MVFKKPKKNYTFINLIIIGLLLLGSVVYLIEVNIGTSCGFKIGALEKKLQLLKIENEYLVREVTEIGSISNIYKISGDLDLVEMAEASYLVAPLEEFAGR